MQARSESRAAMPLDYVDFAHHYEGQGLTEDQNQTQFAPIADFLDCLVRLIWRDGARANELGITLRDGSLLTAKRLESARTFTSTYNDAASASDAERQEP